MKPKLLMAGDKFIATLNTASNSLRTEPPPACDAAAEAAAVRKARAMVAEANASAAAALRRATAKHAKFKKTKDYSAAMEARAKFIADARAKAEAKAKAAEEARAKQEEEAKAAADKAQEAAKKEEKEKQQLQGLVLILELATKLWGVGERITNGQWSFGVDGEIRVDCFRNKWFNFDIGTNGGINELMAMAAALYPPTSATDTDSVVLVRATDVIIRHWLDTP